MDSCVSSVLFSPFQPSFEFRPGPGGSSDPSFFRKLLRLAHASRKVPSRRPPRRAASPKDLEEEAVLKRLPVLFRTLRGKKVSEAQLDRLVDRLRREQYRATERSLGNIDYP